MIAVMIGNNTVVIFINNLKILLNQLFNLPSATLKSCLLVSISDSVSFARRPRSLKELDRWKATEYRSFLLYIGPIVMRNYLSNDVYSHFILLSSAARLLSSEISASSVDHAAHFLKKFVSDAAKYYDPKFYVYNVHSLLHLPNDCLNYGKLTNFDAFPFENLLYIMKPVSLECPFLPIKSVENWREFWPL